MKASELKIGNLVSLDGRVSTVLGIDHRNSLKVKNDFSTFQTSCLNVEPIPLTEDWLKRFRFEKDNYGTFVLNSIDKNENDLWLKIQDNDFGIALNLFHNKKEPTFLDSISYLHQLQNLYFALTGTELTLKQPL